MAVNIEKLGNPLLYNYQYDQLNRLVAMDAWKKTGNTWADLTHQTDLQERVSYDANGNILGYKRNGNTAGGKPLDMDKLAYSYKPGTNQLDYVYDTVPAGNYDVDIDAQSAGNYVYDSIGNLIKDNAEGITSISWTVYGKISRIVKGDSVDISYTYDAAGNRIGKTVIRSGSTDTARTWYVRDAQGNVMSVYESGKPAVNNGHLTQSELHLYGSSRLGLFKRNLDVAYEPEPGSDPSKITMPLLGSGDSLTFVRGDKLFELSNHLGNVLVTVNDKKLGVSANNSIVDYFNPQVVSAQDYYPFGMLQPGRSYNAGGYRYGFNGKENDNEVKGVGQQQDYGMRFYDPRLGKFLSVDPLTKEYPELTPYQFASNTPIAAIDLDGEEAKVITVLHGTNDQVILKTEKTDYFAAEVANSHYEIHQYIKIESKKVTVARQSLFRVNEKSGESVSLFGSIPKGVTAFLPNKSFAPKSNLPKHVSIAIKEIGVEEVVGDGNNPRISNDYFGATTLGPGIEDRIPWCSAFMNFVISQAGIKGTKSALALDWRAWKEGEKVDQPYLGTLVTIRHSDGTGHVGLVTGRNGDQIAILGGNQAIPGNGSEGLIVNNKWNTIASNMVFIHPKGLPKLPLTKTPVAPLATEKLEQIGSSNSR
ncbi:TIGR02594 family protein [Longitalea luteola]|uniref:TIGR02594 family protein n=1 Tax=Longitalea luteola TaxID=2812563 RepID=UPI001A95F210|nr:TIGR02594 family protein [Longitalea luteola]